MCETDRSASAKLSISLTPTVFDQNHRSEARSMVVWLHLALCPLWLLSNVQVSLVIAAATRTGWRLGRCSLRRSPPLSSTASTFVSRTCGTTFSHTHTPTTRAGCAAPSIQLAVRCIVRFALVVHCKSNRGDCRKSKGAFAPLCSGVRTRSFMRCDERPTGSDGARTTRGGALSQGVEIGHSATAAL